MNKILVLGSGAWATALSQVLLANKDNEVSIYGINQDELNDLSHQKNTKFFPNLTLQYAYYAIYNNLDILQVKQFDYLLLAVPSNAIESLLNQINQKSKFDFNLINAAKGFIIDKHDVISSFVLSTHYCHVKTYSCILGPGFAIDVVNERFTVLNVLSHEMDNAKKVCKLFDTSWFKTIPCVHVHAGELTSSLKNPLAIVVGILQGMNISINVISAFVTKGIQEIIALLKALGYDFEIMQQYCGIGDIFLTCSSDKSRNYSFGVNLVKYQTVIETKEHFTKTVEGIDACKVAQYLFDKYDVSTIIFHNLYLLLNNELDVKSFVEKCKAEFFLLK